MQVSAAGSSIPCEMSFNEKDEERFNVKE